MAWHVLEPARVFVPNWHIDCICDHLEAVSRDELNRVVFNVPPGAMKSMTVNVFWPTWEWGPLNRPELRYVNASYSERLTIRDNRKARRLITSPWYKARWGGRFALTGDQNEKVKFENDHTGFKLATSVRGVGTGERGDRVGVDDPHNVLQGESDLVRGETVEWMSEVVPTRVNDQDKSAIIVIMQRVHEADVSGDILARELGYTHVMLPMEFEPNRRCYTTVRPTWMDKKPRAVKAKYVPHKQRWFVEGVPLSDQDREDHGEFLASAPVHKVYNQDPRTKEDELLWPAKMSRATLERDKKAMSKYAVAGQMQQRPEPRGGAMFERAWFDGQFLEPHQVPKLVRIVRHWDLAATKKTNKNKTPARTAGVKIGVTQEGAYVVLSCIAFQEDGVKVRKTIKSTAEADGIRVEVSLPQDPGQAGKVQVRDMVARMPGFVVYYATETGDKETRAEPFATQCAAGNVYLVKGPWNSEYLDELCRFPTAKFKDRVDASSGAFARLIGRSRTEGRDSVAAPRLIRSEEDELEIF